MKPLIDQLYLDETTSLLHSVCQVVPELLQLVYLPSDNLVVLTLVANILVRSVTALLNRALVKDNG